MGITTDKANVLYPQIDDVFFLYFRLITTLSFDLGNGLRISPTEMHMVRRVHEAGEPTVSELAKQAQVTMSATSLLLSKLERKGLIKKKQDLEKRSKVRITTTTLGKTVAAYHEEVHNRCSEQFFQYLGTLDDTEFTVAKEFVNQLKLWLQCFAEVKPYDKF